MLSYAVAQVEKLLELRFQTYADVCCRIQYADVCCRIQYADVCCRIQYAAYAVVYSMLTYAVVYRWKSYLSCASRTRRINRLRKNQLVFHRHKEI